MISLSADYTGLVCEAKKRLSKCSAADDFQTGIPAAERMLIDLDKYSHHFVLACLMDRQIDARRTWTIPYQIGSHVGGFEISIFKMLDIQTIQGIFEKERLHRFNEKMAEVFFLG